ncbi:MAG: hypothetical protein RJA44_317 [Pseudomonadota bacterium]
MLFRSLSGLLDLLAWLPWWLGALLALLSWAGLHWLAGQPLSPGGAPLGWLELLLLGSRHGLAWLGQYLLPALFGLGALISLWRGWMRRTLLEDIASRPGGQVFQHMNWREFEQLVGELFRQQGYQVIETGGNGADGGVDLVLLRDGERMLVQCKQWKALKVSVQVVRELYGVIAAEQAHGGFVVTSGRFTSEARAFAEGLAIELIDGAALHAMVCQLHPQGLRALAPSLRPPKPGAEPADGVPACPECGRPMRPRTARKGELAGQTFWGCSAYPSCRGHREMHGPPP